MKTRQGPSTASAGFDSPLETVLSALRRGLIEEAVAQFCEPFTFVDHGLGLEFTDKARLAEVFRKARELYPDSSVLIDSTFRSDDCVIAEWTLRDTVLEPFFGGLQRTVPIILKGASIVRTDGDNIRHWSEYYDQLTSRRSALAGLFTEWVEL